MNHEEILEDCLAAANTQNHPFTDWEVEFIEDVYDRFQSGQTFLSERQKQILERVNRKLDEFL